jgi:GWxTD domain-containing protein
MNRLLSPVLCLLSFVFLAGCLTLRHTPGKPSSLLLLYNPGRQVMHPQYRIYHSSNSESVVFFKLLANEVVFSQANPQVKDQARLLITYTLYNSLSSMDVAGRDSLEFIIDKEKVKDLIDASLKIQTTPGKTYILDITLEDQIRKMSVRDRVLVDRFMPENQQDWLILGYPDNHPAFENFFYSGETFRLIGPANNSGRLYVSVFPPRNLLPLPPFSTDEQPDNIPLPDSTYSMAYSDQLLYKLGGQGIYIFHFKPEPAKGLCLTQFGDNYPQVKTPEDMLPPLQYITTREEYQKLVASSDHKAAADGFWMERGKSFTTARDLIRVFYNRVVFANIYFASAKQGWKTDRGMIYLLFGPPETVEKTETREIWVYETSETAQKVTFEFNLADDYWIGYDYKLKRREEFRPLWNRAVDSWRRGRIFSM